MHTSLGFLFNVYKPGRYYWEVVSTVQVALLTVLSLFSFSLGAYFTSLLLSMSVALFAAMQLIFQPYALKLLHHAGLLSLACLYFTTCIALTLFVVDGTSAPHIYGDIIGWCGLVANVCFVLWAMYQAGLSSIGTFAVVREALSSMFHSLCGMSRFRRGLTPGTTVTWGTGKVTGGGDPASDIEVDAAHCELPPAVGRM
jgi:hypothetical protein